MSQLITWMLATVGGWGYSGIFILMILESTVLPVPSELVLMPAGYLAYQGQLNIIIILLVATIGSLIGAFFNYGLALLVGRPFLKRYGSYFFVRPELLAKTDHFFLKHGAISTFTGRLLPGIRHLISLPAGLSRMPKWTFAIYTSLGAGLWSGVLTALGYFIGDNEALLRKNLPLVTIAVIVFVTLTITIYIWRQRKNSIIN